MPGTDGRERPTMKHVQDLWFERVSRRDPVTVALHISHTLVVVTDRLGDMDVLDFDGLDYLEGELK